MSEAHSGLSHDLPEYVPNVLPERPPREETVNVALGDDYYLGAYFRTVDSFLDYEVPKSQVERWEAAQAAYGAMQDEIERVMSAQADRVRALYQERHKDKPRSIPPVLEEAYGAEIMRQLNQQLLPPRNEGT